MPGKDRQRALARAKLERQMARRAAAARRRRQVQAGLGAAVAVLIVVAGVWFLVSRLGPDTTSSAAGGTANTAAGGCIYPKSAQPASRDVGVPTVDDVVKTGTQAATLTTNLGTIGVALDLAGAPCTSHSFAHLATQKYFDGTSCHRLTTANIYVLQCGDPTGTSGGGPGYQFANENLPTGREPAYPAGTLAMANSGPDTNGSQFFIVYKDTTLPADYTVFGRVTSGLTIVQGVAAKGVKGGTTDGAPVQAVKFTSVRVAAPQ